MDPFRKKLAVFLLTLAVLLPTVSLVQPRPAQASGFGISKFCEFLTFINSPLPNALRTPAVRENEWYNPSLCQFTLKVFDQTNQDEIFGERYTYAQVVWIINSIGDYIINAFFGVLPGLSATPSNSHLASQGLSGTIGGVITFMQSNQISFVGSASKVLDKFNIATPVHAQGFGYSTLSGGIQALWVVSRNASYLLMIVLLLVAGFMVMFKVRINAQTAVTLQMMIPKIVLTLIAVTFSFAIAGLVIDLVYVSLTFLLTLISTMDPHTPKFIPDLPQALTFFTSANFGSLWGYYNTINGATSIALNFLIPGVGGFILPVLFAILLLRLLIAVARAYIMLLIHIITGPFQILAGLIPTSQSGFGSWFRNVVAHAAVFLVVPLLFFMSMLFLSAGPGGNFLNWLGSVTTGAPNLNPFDPQNLPKLPLFGGADAIFGGDILAAILGYVILLVMPSAVDQTIKAFKAFSFGSASDLDIPLLTSFAAAGQMRQTANQVPGYARNLANQFSGLAQRGAGVISQARGSGGGGSPTPPPPTPTTR